jgi:pyruvate-formate lyase-activating enzyme
LPLTLSAWRCHWCHTPWSARVRLEFLRHSRSPRPRRRASARREPSHGHSP